jgi:hypothetical protein
MSLKAIGSLAVRVSSRDMVRIPHGIEQERGLGIDVDDDSVLLNVPTARVIFRLDVTNARRLYEFLGTAIPLAQKDSP